MNVLSISLTTAQKEKPVKEPVWKIRATLECNTRIWGKRKLNKWCI